MSSDLVLFGKFRLTCIWEVKVLQPCAAEDVEGAGRGCGPYSRAPQSQQPDGEDPACFIHTDNRTQIVCELELRQVPSD